MSRDASSGGRRLSRRHLLRLAAAGAAGYGLAIARPGSARPPDGAEAGAGQIYFQAGRRRDRGTLVGIFAVDPETLTWRKLADTVDAMYPRVSPDGRFLAYGSRDDPKHLKTLVLDLKGGGEPKVILDVGGFVFWSPDGRQLVISGSPTFTAAGAHEYQTWRVDADGANKVRLPVPEAELARDLSPDGAWLVTAGRRQVGDGDPPGAWGAYSISIRHGDGTDPRPIGEPGDLGMYRFAPDSRRLVFIRPEFVSEAPRRHSSLWTTERDGSQRRRIAQGVEDRFWLGACWSPDGRRLAANFQEVTHVEDDKVTDVKRSLVLMDADGGRRRTLDLPHPWPQAFDWR